MKIKLKEISIKDVSNGYINNDEEGVFGDGGKLNILPRYKRVFIYKDKQREDVIKTGKQNCPLNLMYWVENADVTFEVLNGQQRTISVCKYV